MSVITYPSPVVPDLNYEYYTITADSRDVTSPYSFHDFRVRLLTPLRQVVQASLVGAHIHTDQFAEHVFVSVKELDSKFNDRTQPAEDINGILPDEITNTRAAFASILAPSPIHGELPDGDDGNRLILYKNEYPNITQYTKPIEYIDRLTIKIYNEDGNVLQLGAQPATAYLIFRFVCRAPNVPVGNFPPYRKF